MIKGQISHPINYPHYGQVVGILVTVIAQVPGIYGSKQTEFEGVT